MRKIGKINCILRRRKKKRWEQTHYIFPGGPSARHSRGEIEKDGQFQEQKWRRNPRIEPSTRKSDGDIADRASRGEEKKAIYMEPKEKKKKRPKLRAKRDFPSPGVGESRRKKKRRGDNTPYLAKGRYLLP